MQAGKSTKFIIDASFVLAFLLPDERQAEVVEIFDQYSSGKIELTAPTLLPYEIINGLKSAILRKRVNLKEASDLVEQFLNLTIFLEETDLLKVLEISVNKEISVYDASYLYLSQKENIKLVSLDEKFSIL